MRIREVVTAAQSPWQNPFVERLIGSVRRECLDHVLGFRETHLRRLLTPELTSRSRRMRRTRGLPNGQRLARSMASIIGTYGGRHNPASPSGSGETQGKQVLAVDPARLLHDHVEPARPDRLHARLEGARRKWVDDDHLRDQAIWTFQNRGAMNFKMPWTFLRNAVGSTYSPHGT